MKSVSLSSPRHLGKAPRTGVLDKLGRRAVFSRLERMQIGHLRLVLPGEEYRFGDSDPDAEPRASIEVLDPAFFSELAFGGSIGAGEAWMHGLWDCDDLVALVRLMLRNREVLDGIDTGTSRLTAPLKRLFHLVNRNTRKGARRNISAHYDLGNDFFALWLDATMMYSCAIFEREDMSLHEAQLFRLEQVCRKLQLKPGEHVVEIGTGWGGFAIYAAKHFGVRVTTTTISQEQYMLACERVEEAGLSGRITVLNQDFRDLEGRFDKLVSIEMIEAIDTPLYRTFFEKCSALLQDDGLMLLQAITIADQRYDPGRKSIDFNQRYIFPGSGLPSSAAMSQTAAQHTDMRLLDLQDIGLHYATTLQRWRARFHDKLDEVRSMGYPEPFIRMWDYYLCYCDGAFQERAISDVHMIFGKPGFRSGLNLPNRRN
jgi:cyclopropane-fatty-acyl-phospholipid synthase